MKITKKNNCLIVIAGPTGVGKTTTAIEVAKKLDAEIISADSRQFYREMKIGTAAPTLEELSEVPHHFVGHKSITEYYNANMYEQEVLAFLQKYFRHRQVAVMTGGSGMYIDAVCRGIDDIPGVDTEIRNQVKALWQQQGLEALQRVVARIDPDYYAQADVRNPMRLRRALEVYRQTGRPLSAFRKKTPKSRPFRIIKTALYLPREELYARINKRVDKMLEKGLWEEARQLYAYKQLNSLNTVGYKEIFEALAGRYDFTEAVRLIKRNSRRYAKRQMTWLKRDKSVHWFLMYDYKKLIDFMLEKIYEK